LLLSRSLSSAIDVDTPEIYFFSLAAQTQVDPIDPKVFYFSKSSEYSIWSSTTYPEPTATVFSFAPHLVTT